MKYIKYFLILTIALVLNQMSPVYAASVTNKGSIGAVDVKLSYEIKEDVTAVLPGQTVAINSFVSNVAEPAWIRVKIEYPCLTNQDVIEHLSEHNLTALSDDLITFAGDKWKKIGSYYYWTEAVKTGDKVPFTDTITFPNDWDNQVVQSQFGICITAEAIQEKHFEPDFNAEDPWKGVVIEAYDSDNYVPKKEGNEQFKVTYEGGAEGLVILGDNFFSNWSQVMPGDVLTGEAEISNSMKIPVKIHFKAESKDNGEVLKSLGLKIWNGDSVVFEGTMADNIEEVLLKEYASGEKTTFKYEVSVPETLDNTFAEKPFETTWTFRAEEIPQSEKTKSNPEKTSKEKTPKEKISEVIKTGDTETKMILFGCVILTLLLGASVAYFIRQKGAKR